MRAQVTNNSGETLTVDYTLDNICVYDSYTIRVENIPEWIVQVREVGIENGYAYDRTNKSWVREWKAHNILFKWGIAPSKTKDVDLNENESLFKRFCYFILSALCINNTTK